MASEQEIEAAADIIAEVRDPTGGAPVLERAAARALAARILDAAERVRARQQSRPAYKLTEARGQS